MQGKGTSNTVNIGRRFFENAQEVSETAGLNKILIERFKVILSVLACSVNVKSEKYDNYVEDTLKLYLSIRFLYTVQEPYSLLLFLSGFCPKKCKKHETRTT